MGGERSEVSNAVVTAATGQVKTKKNKVKGKIAQYHSLNIE